MNLITNCSVFQRSINSISPVIRTDHYISFFIHKDCYPNTDPASIDYLYIVRLFISRKSSLSEWWAKESCLCQQSCYTDFFVLLYVTSDFSCNFKAFSSFYAAVPLDACNENFNV